MEITPDSSWTRFKQGLAVAFAAILAFFVYGYRKRGAEVTQLKTEKDLTAATTRAEVATANLGEEKKKYENNYKTYEDIKRDNAAVLRKYGVDDGSGGGSGKP